jgi:hypothetical protein
MLSAMDKRKPTVEEIASARNALEAEIEKLGRGDGSTTAERVKLMSDAFETMLRHAKDEPDA